MAKKKNPRRGNAPKQKPTALEIAAKSIERIAQRDHTTPEMVRKHIQTAMINGLISEDPQVRAMWAQIPHAGEVPTPEEVIAHFSSQIAGYGTSQ